MKTFSKRVVQNLALAAFSLCMFTIGIEVVLRATHAFDARVSYSMPDSILAYRFVPHAEYYYHKENPKVISGRFNNFGWRDREWSVEKPANVLRVAVLGDSFVEAFQVEEESTFVRRAEALLRTRFGSTNIEVMNFGRSGFTQTDELWLLQNDVARFSPDIVVVCFLPFNDIEDVRRETAPDDERPFYIVTPDSTLQLDTQFTSEQSFKTKIRIDWFKRHSAFISLLAERYSTFKLRRDIARQQKEVSSRATTLSGYLSLCTAHPDSAFAVSYRMNKLLFRHMANYCAQTRKAMMILCLDNEAYVPQKEKEFLTIDPTFQHTFFEDDLAELSSALQIHYLGIQRVFRNAYIERQRPLHWGHFNYEGHAVAAEALAQSLDTLINRHKRQ